MQRSSITGTAAAELIRADALLAFAWVPEGAIRWAPGAHGGWEVPSRAEGAVVFLDVSAGQAFTAAPLALKFTFTTGVHAETGALTFGRPWSWDPATGLLDPHRAMGGDAEAAGAFLFTAGLARESRVAEEVRLQGTDELGHWAPLDTPVPVQVRAGAGDDTLVGGAAADGLLGEDGSDRITGGDGADNIRGGAGRDILDGQRGDDLIEGGEGDDVISGGSGNDTVAGGAGNDVLYSFRGHDLLFGGEGRDTLVGGQGPAELAGGGDADLFVLGKGWPLPPGSPGNTVGWSILDFSPAEGDRVDLRHFRLAEQGIGVVVEGGEPGLLLLSLRIPDGHLQAIATIALADPNALPPQDGWLLA
jgi:hypothetical protein